MCIAKLFQGLGQLKTNALIIGQNNAWLVNCVTSHSHYVVGTKAVLPKNFCRRNKQGWSRIKNLLMRHASPGSQINCYCLFGDGDSELPFVTVSKSSGSKFQPPSCTLPSLNGVKLPVNIEIPIVVDQ